MKNSAHKNHKLLPMDNRGTGLVAEPIVTHNYC